MNVRLIALVAAVATTALGSVASAQQISVNPAVGAPLRGGRGSDRNIRLEMRKLEQTIDMLQRDRRDYGGHREQAIDLLQRARQQLEEALEYDNSHSR